LLTNALNRAEKSQQTAVSITGKKKAAVPKGKGKKTKEQKAEEEDGTWDWATHKESVLGSSTPHISFLLSPTWIWCGWSR
jgi:hypothetical protein